MIIKLPEHLSEKSTHVLNEQLASVYTSHCLTVVFDFSRVREMDSEAMETLLHCMNQIAQNDGTIRISGMSAEAEIFLELTRMDSVFAMFREQPAPLPAAAVEVPAFTGSVMRDHMQVSAA